MATDLSKLRKFILEQGDGLEGVQVVPPDLESVFVDQGEDGDRARSAWLALQSAGDPDPVGAAARSCSAW